MKQKNGFVFIETIVAIVVLTSSLLLLYSSFNKILQTEKTRLYYDDMTFLARTNTIKNALNKVNIIPIMQDLIDDNSKQFLTVGVEYRDLFKGYEDDKEWFISLMNELDVNQMIILKENKVDNIRSCTLECANNTNCSNYNNCNDLYTNLSVEFITYLKSIYVDVSCTYVLAIEYNVCMDEFGKVCKNFYGWVSV